MRLTISTTYPIAKIKTHLPEAQIKQKIIQVKIDRNTPLVEIDQRQSYGELGLGGYAEFNTKIREKNFQEALAGIARLAQEGDEVMNRAGLFLEEMIFADLAKRRWAEDIPELNVQAAPRTRPTIKFHHEQSITWEPGGAEIEFYLRPPHIDWQLGKTKLDVTG